MTNFMRRPAVLVCALMLSGVLAGCSAAEETASVEGTDSAATGKPAGVGDKVTLKGTTYKVTRASSAKSIGDNQFTRTKANGQFVVVKLTLTNRKDEPATILESNLKLVGGNGKTYSTSTDALLAVDDAFILEEIQPDVSQRGTLVYDIPKKAVAGAVLRAEDLFSDSVAEITLGL
jgi:hypothetical protein